jgi:hypothetical protein
MLLSIHKWWPGILPDGATFAYHISISKSTVKAYGYWFDARITGALP